MTDADPTPKTQEFSKAILVPNGIRVADTVHDLVDEFMKSAENSAPTEYNFSIDIELAHNNIAFIEKYGTRFTASVAIRCTMYRFEDEPA